MTLKALSILAAAASLAAISPAHAQTYAGDDTYAPAPTVGEVVVIAPSGYAGEREIKRVPVFFADLDLDSRDGGYTLLTRIRSAARQACTPAANFRDDLGNISDYQRCIQRAVDHAVRDVGAPAVQDAYYDLGVGTADLPGG